MTNFTNYNIPVTETWDELSPEDLAEYDEWDAAHHLDWWAIEDEDYLTRSKNIEPTLPHVS